MVTPRQLLGPLSEEQLEDILNGFENLEFSDNRSIQAYDLKWLDGIMDRGFLVMPMNDDPELQKELTIAIDL